MASVSGSEVSSEGPVLSAVNKRIRALRKKLTRIVQMEESVAQGKTLNKEQEDVLRSKPAVVAIIDELEKLRQPLSIALQEELSRTSPPRPPSPPPKEEKPSTDDDETSADLKDLIAVLYFGSLFDVKPQTEFTSTMLTKTHERGCCLTYDYVTDDATELLGERDLDMISALGGLLTSRPVYSGVSHRNALQGCMHHAKLWLQNSDQPIHPEASITYAGLREKLNKIMASDYFTTTPEMKAPVDVAAAMGMYNRAASQIQVAESGTVPELDDGQTDDAPAHYQHKEDQQEDFQATEVSSDHSSPADELQKDEADEPNPAEDFNTAHQDQEKLESDPEHSQRDVEIKEQQYISRRGYQGQRGGSRGGGGGGRRGYVNGRGGRGGRGGGGNGYQNGRSQQFYDSGYYPRNYYNTRGRGRSGGSAMFNNHTAPANHGSHVELGAGS